jgi:hypothetical protein
MQEHTASQQYLAYSPYFEKIKVGFWGHLAVCVFPLLIVEPEETDR